VRSCRWELLVRTKSETGNNEVRLR